jgi:ABC-2 type transport system permease protein
MKGFKTYLVLFFCDCKIKLARAMEFRADFFSGIFISLIFSGMAPLFQFFIYSKTNGYPGWNLEQIILFQAVFLLWTGISDLLFGNVRVYIESTIQSGLMDRLLVLPYSSIGIILTRGFNYKGIGTALAGMVALVIAIIHLPVKFHWWYLLQFLFFFIIGILLTVSLLIIFCTIALRIIYVMRLKEVMDRVMFFGSFPAEIYSGLIRFVYLTAIPIGIWIYYPAQALLGRLDIYAIYGALISVALFFISKTLWNFQVKKYISAGG